MAGTVKIGRVGLALKGDYDSSIQYEKLDVVAYNGNSYVAKQKVQGALPTNATYWQPMTDNSINTIVDTKVENAVAPVKEDVSQLSESITEIENLYMEFIEKASQGATNNYKKITEKLKVGIKYAFRVTSRVQGTYLFQAGIGQSASNMTDIGTYFFADGQTRTIIGYATDNPNIKYFRLYSADVSLEKTDWDVSVYAYFDVKDEMDKLKTESSENFSKLINANVIPLNDGVYFNTSGEKVDVNSPLKNNGWCSAVVKCSYGDTFTITGEGGSAPRLWVFADENGAILEKNTRSVETNLEISAPKDAKYLVANFNVYSNKSDKLLLAGSSLSNRLEIADYENKITTKHKIVVAKDGTGDFTSIKLAINNILDSSFTNQYEIVLKEGTYNEQDIVLPPYTYLHGVGRNKPVISSVGLSDYVSVLDVHNTCRIANLKVISETKYCLHEDVSLYGCTVICENIDFEQHGNMNQTIIGNGVFENAKFVFDGCTFKGGQVFSHTNSMSFIGITQHLAIRYCKFIDAGIVLATSGNVESNSMADCICEVVGCKGDETYPLVTCRVPSDNVFPWKVIGGCNTNFSVAFDGETLSDVVNTTD